MSQTHRRIGRVDTLSTVAGRAHHINTDILLVDLHLHLLGFRHHSDTDGRGVDAPAGLGLWNTLYAVYAGLVFHDGISTLPGDHKCHTLHPANAGLIHLHQLRPPVFTLRIMLVHTVYLRRKKRRLITARTGADLHDNILVIIRIFRQQQNLKCVLQFLHPGLRAIQLFLCKLTHLLVRFLIEHRQRIPNILFTLLVLSVRLNERCEIALLLHQFAEALRVVRYIRLAQLAHKLFKTNQ